MHKPTRLIKQMSLNGSVLIPAELRYALHWDAWTYIEIYPFEDFLVLKAAPETDGLMYDLNKALRDLSDDNLRDLLYFILIQKKKQGRS